MDRFVWAAFGMAVGAAVLNFALGLRRPLDRTYLSFALVMVFLAAYLYYEHAYYHAITRREGVTAIRHQLVAAHGFLGCILVFIPAYTGVRVPRWLMALAWLGLVTLFVANLWLPYGIWFSALPDLVRSSWQGQSYSSLIAPPMRFPQIAHAIYVMGVFGLALGCALVLIRRGARQRGQVLAISVLVILIHHLVDLARETVGGTWPYIAEFGVASWGLIMSVQLATDFKRMERQLETTLVEVEHHTALLAEKVVDALQVRDRLNSPLQTLELGLALRTASTPEQAAILETVRTAVRELAELGRNVERTVQAPLPAPPEPPA